MHHSANEYNRRCAGIQLLRWYTMLLQFGRRAITAMISWREKTTKWTAVTEEARRSLGTKTARLVLTHSTYCEGLLPVLKKLSEQDGIRTLTPARFFRFKGRRDHFQLSIRGQTRSGFRLVGRKGTTAQEVFCVTNLDHKALDEAIKMVLREESGKGSTHQRSKPTLTRRQMRRTH